MAKKTYSDIVQQIEKLQAEAEALRHAEVQEVIARIREAVKVYGLTPDDLFGKRPGARRPAAKDGGRGRGAGTKYSDGAGNTWGGRGPRPRWLREALARGATLDSFLTNASAESDTQASSAAPARRKAAGSRGAAKKRAGAAKKARGGRRSAARARSGAPAAVAEPGREGGSEG